MTGVFIREGADRERLTERGRLRQDGGILPQAKEWFPEAGRGKERFFPRASEWSVALLILDLWSPEL